MSGKTLLIALGALIVASNCALAVTSTFDTGSDGWVETDMADYVYTNILGTYSLTWSGTEGRPGGCVAGYDPTGNTFWYSAPAKFLGNQSAAFNTIFSYDIKLNSSYPTYWEIADVVLRSGNSALVYMNPQMPTASWTTRSVLLKGSAGWHKDSLTGAAPTDQEFINILKSLTGLYIRGEYISGSERPLLDNVKLGVPTVGTSIKSIKDAIMSKSAFQYDWVFWGKVKIVDTNNFTLDDGSGVLLKVYKSAHGLSDGNTVSVKGVLNSTNPPIMTAISVTVQ